MDEHRDLSASEIELLGTLKAELQQLTKEEIRDD